MRGEGCGVSRPVVMIDVVDPHRRGVGGERAPHCEGTAALGEHQRTDAGIDRGELSCNGGCAVTRPAWQVPRLRIGVALKGLEAPVLRTAPQDSFPETH